MPKKPAARTEDAAHDAASGDAAAGAGTTKSPAQKALEKLGLKRDIDLALHLPLRYEDETRIVKLTEVREGQQAQIEAVVTHQEVTFRPRRQLIVTVDDGSDTCTLRFFSFYGSQQKALAVGNRIRVQGRLSGPHHAAPHVSRRRGQPAHGAHPHLPHGGRFAPALPAQGGVVGLGALRFVGHLCAR